ncbi:hypothetical protein C8J57DRAFT_1226496 [Mycena rebaudengoi]|nr:hypothetical protein C8J57DRAFT_1226496 [Mycena rebaudengoi]
MRGEAPAGEGEGAWRPALGTWTEVPTELNTPAQVQERRETRSITCPLIIRVFPKIAMKLSHFAFTSCWISRRTVEMAMNVVHQNQAMRVKSCQSCGYRALTTVVSTLDLRIPRFLTSSSAGDPVSSRHEFIAMSNLVGEPVPHSVIWIDKPPGRSRRVQKQMSYDDSPSCSSSISRAQRLPDSVPDRYRAELPRSALGQMFDDGAFAACWSGSRCTEEVACDPWDQDLAVLKGTATSASSVWDVVVCHISATPIISSGRNPPFPPPSSLSIANAKSSVLDNLAPDDLDIRADLESQQEDVPQSNQDDAEDLDEEVMETEPPPETLRQRVSRACKGTTERTEKEYDGLRNAFNQWLAQSGLWLSDRPFFTPQPHEDAPILIVLWIMSLCDNKDMDGKPIPRSQKRKSYSYAMKMRAMFTSTFQKDHGLGKVFWHQADDGIWRGNPSVSNHVSGYMVNLHRSKELLRRMYDFSNDCGRSTIQTYETAMSFPNDAWGSPRRRIQSHALMLISMWCLLRCDEAVRINFEDIEYFTDDAEKPGGPPFFVLTLRWRKTNQTGGRPPFH